MDGVTVITSAYGAKDTIRDYFEGFQDQVDIDVPVEFLIGVDGCPDTLKAIEENSWCMPQNTRVFNFKDNCGTYVVFNSILHTRARYDHIIRFDADDVPFPYFLQSFKETMLDPSKSPDIVRFLSHDELMAFGTIGFKKSVFEEMGGYKSWKCSSDYEFMLRANRMGFNIGHVEYPVFQRGVSERQLSSDPSTSLTSEYRASLNKQAQESVETKISADTASHSEVAIFPTAIPPRPLLGVVMIVKNEQKVLEKCLESVKDADEIVIVDTGSKDKTVDIAKRYTDKVSVGEFEWCWDYSKARNFAVSRCTAQYLLSIDADEVLQAGGIAKLKEIIKQCTPTCWAFALKMCSGQMYFHNIRMWRNHRGLKYAGAGHEYITRTPPDVYTDVTIDFGCSPNHEKEPGRMFVIMQNAVAKEPNIPRNVFYLAREYSYHGDYASAIRLYDRYISISSYGAEIAEAYLQKARCFLALSDAPSAKNSLLAALGINIHFKEAWRALAGLSDPFQRDAVMQHAALADNSNVLFVRDVSE